MRRLIVNSLANRITAAKVVKIESNFYLLLKASAECDCESNDNNAVKVIKSIANFILPLPVSNLVTMVSKKLKGYS